MVCCSGVLTAAVVSHCYDDNMICEAQNALVDVAALGWCTSNTRAQRCHVIYAPNHASSYSINVSGAWVQLSDKLKAVCCRARTALKRQAICVGGRQKIVRHLSWGNHDCCS
jgi:hypothetical protein